MTAQIPPRELLDRIKCDLEYRPISGELIWLRAVSNHPHLVGKRAGSVKITHERRYRVLALKHGGKRYAMSESNVCYFLHEGVWPETELDHENRDGTDNHWKNLRLATRAQNMQNRGVRKDSKSGITGVTWREDIGKWAVQIYAKGKNRCIGYFHDLDKAIAVRQEAVRKYHDAEFARA